MKTLYVHIGTPKTGTTSIQQFCTKNADVLRKKGYCYPTSFFRYPVVAAARNGHFLVGTVKDENGHRCKEREKQNYQEGMEQVQNLFVEFDKIILSDEAIWRAMDLYRKDLWADLQQEAKKGGFGIKVIVYLRRQDKLIGSIWNQSVKSLPTLTEKRIDDYLQEINTEVRLDYWGKIERLASILGKENIIVRRFDREGFVGGTIYADFLEAIDLAWTDEYQVQQNVHNLGLSGNPVEIKRIINGLPQTRNTQMQNFFREVLRDCSQISKKTYSCEMFSKEETEALLAKYEEGNRKIAQEYLGEEELFDNEVEDIPKWEPDNPYMLEDVIRFIGMSNVYLLEEIQTLKEDNRKLKQEMDSFRYKVKHPLYAIATTIQRKMHKDLDV